MPLGLPEFLVVLTVFLLVVPVLLLPFLLLPWFLRARQQGYPSLRVYLKSAPRSDAERRDAAHLAMAGLVYCFLGVLFAPLVLAGLVPLYYGGRKLIYAFLGLGLIDDADEPGA